MSSQDYDRVIAQEQKVLASIKEHCEKIIPEFKDTTTLYVHDWSIKLMKAHWTAKPEITKGLGRQKTEEMKAEFKAILAALPAVAKKRLDDPQIWLHRFEIPDHELTDLSYSYYLEKRSKKYLNLAIKELIGPVGALLNNYGFIMVEDDFSWELTPGEFPRYADNLPERGVEGHQELTKLLERYKNLLIEYVYASQNLWKAEQAKKSAEAN